MKRKVKGGTDVILGWVGRGDVCTMWVHVWWVGEVNIGGKIDGGRNMHVQYMY